MNIAFQQPSVRPDVEEHSERVSRQDSSRDSGSIAVITDDARLRALCRRLRGEKFLAVDTEFMRDRSYWPKLCLIQLAGEKEAAIIDPLHGGGLDLAPLYQLLRKPDIVKVFHAARQDIEIFFHEADLLPTPVFDTQVAAMVCGFGDAASYATLVRRLVGATLDKSSRLTDWSRRPLSQKQLAYALDDVVYLRHVYEILASTLTESGRLAWVEEEMARLVAPETYSLDPRSAWRRLKRRQRSRRFLAILIEVAAWRESLAQQRNIPRPRILKDDGLYEVVAAAPSSRTQLEDLRAVPKGFGGGKYAQSLLKAVAVGEALAKDKSHVLPKERSSAPPVELVQAHSELVDLLKLLLKRQCEQHKVASRLVSDVSALEAFAVATETEEKQSALLSGWRREVFGELALQAKRGRVGFGIENGRLNLFALDGARRLASGEEKEAEKQA